MSGYIYKIDRKLLKIYGVAEHIVTDYATLPSIPEDKEVILVASDFGTLPKEIVTEILRFRICIEITNMAIRYMVVSYQLFLRNPLKRSG